MSPLRRSRSQRAPPRSLRPAQQAQRVAHRVDTLDRDTADTQGIADRDTEGTEGIAVAVDTAHKGCRRRRDFAGRTAHRGYTAHTSRSLLAPVVAGSAPVTAARLAPESLAARGRLRRWLDALRGRLRSRVCLCLLRIWRHQWIPPPTGCGVGACGVGAPAPGAAVGGATGCCFVSRMRPVTRISTVRMRA